MNTRLTRSARLRFGLWLGAAAFLGFAAFWMRVGPSYAQQTNSAFTEPRATNAVGGPAGCGQAKYRLRPQDAQPTLEEDKTRELGRTMTGAGTLTIAAPPNPDGSTFVDIGLFVIEITDVDESQNTFQLEGFLNLAWCDPRLAFNAQEAGLQSRIFLEEQALTRLGNMWWPDLDFVNETHSRERANEELTIFADGTVEYREKFHTTLATNFNMRRFPFDTQTLSVAIESFAWSSDQLRFQVEDAVVAFSREFSIPEWKVIGLNEQVENRQEVRDRAAFSTLLVQILVGRDPGSYLTKIMLPLAMIVMISWVVFWMTGDGLADRMNVSFTGVLTSVAYQFIVSERLPRHVYSSYLDAMVLLSFVTMVATIVENIAVNNLWLQERTESARRIDRISRWAFPIAYFGGLLLLMAVYLT